MKIELLGNAGIGSVYTNFIDFVKNLLKLEDRVKKILEVNLSECEWENFIDFEKSYCNSEENLKMKKILRIVNQEKKSYSVKKR